MYKDEDLHLRKEMYGGIKVHSRKTDVHRVHQPVHQQQGRSNLQPERPEVRFLGLQEGGRPDGICMSLKKVKMRKNNGKCYLFGIY